MTPLTIFCGFGLLTLSLGAAITPDVTPAPETLAHLAPRPVSVSMPASVPMPTAGRDSTDAKRGLAEAKRAWIEAHNFSREMLPPREVQVVLPAFLSPTAIESRIRSQVITPLEKQAERVRMYSRKRLPRRSTFEYDVKAPAAPEAEYIAFDLNERPARGGRDVLHPVAAGRVHRTTGAVELRFVDDAKAPFWMPAAKALAQIRAR